MPTLITINLKNGQKYKIVPELVGNGAGRDAFGGTLEKTTTQCPWILKIQEWNWHEKSNGREYRFCCNQLMPFTPKMLGCARCEYNTCKGSTTLSVLVVARVPSTMKETLAHVMQEPACVSGIRILLALVHSLFDIVIDACGCCKMKLTDLHTDNIGVDNDNRVLLLDVESATFVPAEDDRWDPKSKSRASQGIKTFAGALWIHGIKAERSWKQCVEHIRQVIFNSWWNGLHQLPSLKDVSNKIDECLEGAFLTLPSEHTVPPSVPLRSFTNDCGEKSDLPSQDTIHKNKKIDGFADRLSATHGMSSTSASSTSYPRHPPPPPSPVPPPPSPPPSVLLRSSHPNVSPQGLPRTSIQQPLRAAADDIVTPDGGEKSNLPSQDTIDSRSKIGGCLEGAKLTHPSQETPANRPSVTHGTTSENATSFGSSFCHSWNKTDGCFEEVHLGTTSKSAPRTQPKSVTPQSVSPQTPPKCVPPQMPPNQCSSHTNVAPQELHLTPLQRPLHSKE